MSTDKTITLIAYDGTQETSFTVNVDWVKESATLSNMLTDLGGADENTKIPLESVKADSLKRIVQYLEHISENQAEKVDMATLRDKDLNDWEKKFCEMPQAEMFDMIMAANYLDIKHLMDISCKSVANSMRGLNAEEIRQKFGIENDFSPEEYSAAVEANRWLEEK